eukprot:TRINITY_DN5776_c0_g1_i1.p1 TRINITY_DN5776_c0_g1~~TRINITY_DN5776_c0_g1_i1.p1  ORF type:complete len:377 (-),score=38.35 TRINITY_DN5776_c0_g1_i1:84-1214(-)
MALPVAFADFGSASPPKSDDAEIDILVQEEEATVCGSAVRTFTNLTRPLSSALCTTVLILKIKLKHCAVLAGEKVAFAIEKTMKNPTKLFTRQAISPWDAFRGHPEGLLAALRAEANLGGLFRTGRKAIGPYLTNATIAFSMFQTYTLTRLVLREMAQREDDGAHAHLHIEACAGFSAGIVQASLNTPLYNLKLGRSKRVLGELPPKRAISLAAESRLGILAGLQALQHQKGFLAIYQNYPYVVLQEGCSLAAYFTSYEFMKFHMTKALRTHVDPTGQKDLIAWAAAASAAGIVLHSVGTPFENVLEWHISRRGAATPKNAFRHLFSETERKVRRRILLSDVRSKLLMAPLAGVPLLAYEIMSHGGVVPALHEFES